jgi:Tfp pilus assembly protein PilO
MVNISLDNVQVKHKVLLISLGFILVCSAAYFGAIRPQRMAITTMKAQYQTERQRVKAITDYVRTNPDPDQHLADVHSKVAVVDRMLPNTGDIGAFLLQLQAAAKQSNVQLSQVRPGQASNMNNLGNIPVELKIKGSYFQVLDFLRLLENETRFVKIISINLHAQGDLLESKLALLVYSYVPGEIITKPTQ